MTNYRQTDESKCFTPSNFTIALFTADGKWVIANFGSNFFQTLMSPQTGSLVPGKYMFLVDPIWNKVDEVAEYKNVQIDIYATDKFEIAPVEDEDAIEVFAKALKDAAVNTLGEEKRNRYLRNQEGYGEDVYRIISINDLKCWYGFIYTNNDSNYSISEDLMPKLKGLEVIYPLEFSHDEEKI